MAVPTFEEAVESGLGAVVIFAGSGSDKEHITALENALDNYKIARQVRIASAHKQPGAVINLVKAYDNFNVPLVYIAVAGGTDALSGMLSFHSARPVISCPPEYGKKEINQSCLNNPSGSSNAFVARPDNAARFAAQILSYHNPWLKGILLEEARDKICDLDRDDASYRGREGNG